MKLREAIAWRREGMVVDAEVEIDGKYAGGHIRLENKVEDRIDRRLKKYQNMKCLCALAIRQRGLGGGRRSRGSSETKTAMRLERPSEITCRGRQRSSRTSTATMAGLNALKRVNNSKAYQTDDGTNTNQVESFFSRVQ
jgi:hypothetical protein